MKTQFGQLKAQVAELNAELAKTAGPKGAVNPAGWRNANKAVAQYSQTFRDAANSTGMWEAAQVRASSATDDYIKKLERQKVTFRDMYKDHGMVMRQAYHEQLRMQNAMVTKLPGTDARGRAIYDVAVPAETLKSWDTLGQRIKFVAANMHSASIQLTNWGKNMQWAGRQMTVGLTYPLIAFGALTGKLAYDVNDQMTRIRKVYDTTASQTSTDLRSMSALQDEYAKVTQDSWDTAVKATKAYGAAATDTLNITAQLAAQGQKGTQLQQGTLTIQRYSMLGDMPSETTIDAYTALINTLGLTAQQAGKQFDYMNAVENATSLSMDDFAQAIPRALGPLHEMGGSIKDLGTLLVAMKSQGIDAAQGANAIKAMMQRLYRPSEQVKKEWQGIAHIDLEEVVQKSGGNVIKMLQQIGDAVQGLDRPERVKLLGGLFGTYQVARMSAMLKGLRQMNEEGTQMQRVNQLNAKSWQDYADIAQNEIKQVQESASQQFRVAVNDIKNQLTEIGPAFLQMGTSVLKTVSKIINVLEGLPAPIKNFAKYGAIFVALAGPLTMLTGLFANLIGTVLRLGIATGGLFGKFDLLNKETMASRAAMALAEKGMLSAGQATSLLAASMSKLVESQQIALEQSPAIAESQVKESELLRAEAIAAEAAAKGWQELIDMRLASGKTVPTSAYNMVAQNETKAIGMHAMADEAARTEAAAAKAAQATGKVEENAAKGSKSMGMMSKSGLVFAGAMGASMVSSNATVDHLANMAMAAAVIGPALVGGAKGIGGMSKGIKEAGGLTSVLKSKWVSLGPLLARAFNPVTLALTAVVGGYILISHKSNELKKQQEEINNSVDNWASKMGIVLNKAKEINKEQDKYNKGQLYSDLAKTYQDTNSAVADEYRNAKSSDKQDILMREYSKATDRGMSRAETNQMLGGLIFLDTKSVDQTNKALDSLNAKIKSYGKNWRDEIRKIALRKELGGDLDAISTQFNAATDGIVKNFNTLFSNLSGKGRSDMFNQLTTSFSGAWDGVFQQVRAQYSGLLNELGVNTGKDFQKLMNRYNQVQNGQLSSFQFGKMYGSKSEADTYSMIQEIGLSFGAANTNAGKLAAREADIVNQLADYYGLSDKVYTIEQLRAALAEKGQISKSIGEAKKQYQDYLAAHKDAGDQERLSALNAARIAAGLKPTTSEAAQFAANITGAKVALRDAGNAANGTSGDVGKIADNAKRATTEAKKLRNALANVDWASEAQSVMSNVQSQLADIASTNFDNMMNAAMDKYSAAQQGRLDALTNRQEAASAALQNRQEAASRALENRQQAATDHFEKMWEKRKAAVSKAYDDRINKINKEISAEQKAEDIRQKIFDAEQARIQRANQTANSQVDFQVALTAGNLDEATKIANDMQAQQEQWSLEDANKRAEAASERSIARLQKQVDKIDQIKEKRLKALDAVEERERKALERSQERQTRALQHHQEEQQKALEKAQEAQQKALQQEVDNNIAAQQEIWDSRKKKMDDAIALFEAYVPKNEADLRKHIANISKQYGDFNAATEGKFDKTSVRIGDMLATQTTIAANSIKSQVEWEAIGKDAARKLFKGALNMDLAGFTHWMKTGEWPTKGGNKHKHASAPEVNMAHIPSNHEGGWAGAHDSRKGVARTNPLHPSETFIRAQKGEFIVNRLQAANHAQLLSAINSGEYDKNAKGGSGSPLGLSGMMMGALGGALIKGLKNSIVAQNDRKKQEVASAIAETYSAGKAGKYGDTVFSADQLANAAIIASVGRSLGASSRDIIIALMTAMQESTLRNLDYGDRDSVGLFQQRAAWGSFAERTNPKASAKMFFTGGHGGQRGLFDFPNRGDMSLAEAAQSVQVSAYPDAYAKWANEAKAILNGMHAITVSGGGVSGGTMGPGGSHRPIGYPVTQGIHDNPPAVDMAAPIGTPVYAVGNGRVTRSYDIRGYESRRMLYGQTGPGVQDGFRSYGRVMYLKPDNHAGEVIYAHLSDRKFNAGTRVTGGTVLGLSGNTGNVQSSRGNGAHLHFAATAGSPYDYLDKGGFIMKNGLAYLHEGEVALTKPLTQELVNNVANGGNNTYNVIVNTGNNADADEIANKVISKIRAMEARRPQGRK